MPRPKVPLISKRKTLEAALRIIDTEGLDAMSVRRLAIELNVNAASLYHHFRNKDESSWRGATGARRSPHTGHPRRGLAGLAEAQRRPTAAGPVAHPDLIPIMMRRDLLGIGVAELDATAALLEEEGVPLGAVAPILDYGELLAICARSPRPSTVGRPVIPSDEHPHLRKANLKAVEIDEIFTEAYAAGVEAILARTPQVGEPHVPAHEAHGRGEAGEAPRRELTGLPDRAARGLLGDNQTLFVLSHAA